LLDRLKTLMPFGREFETPVFEAYCSVKSIKPLGQDGLHFQIQLLCEGRILTAIWFNACEPGISKLPVNIDDEVHAVFSLLENVFRDQRTVQCQLHYLQKR
jgi:single-stranded-DNA-specific exonuclease